MSTQDSGVGRARGRGRAQLLLGARETQRPGDIGGALAAVVSPAQPAGAGPSPSISLSTTVSPSSATTTTEVKPGEKPRRGGAPVVFQQAPRGKGIEHLMGGLEITPKGTPIGRGREYTYAQVHGPHTRPEHIIDKRGTGGDPIELVANYIKILSRPEWELFQYHIDFRPDIVEQRKMRREIVNQHQGVLKDVAFDGTTMYSFIDMGDERIFECRHPHTGERIEMVLKKTSVNAPDSPNFFHLANLIVRKLLEFSNLKLIGRNYYSFDQKIDLERYRLTLFPGFMTNVNVYESQLMINVDLSHKVLNKTTVYERLQNIFTQFNDYRKSQDVATKELVGQIVLTTYNSKTYKIDEIDWDNSPTFKFTKRDGTEQTFLEYYEERYQIKIEDATQPLLISKPSKRDRRAGMTGPLKLIPELCCVTGISDIMRSDFAFMKEMSNYTHVDPNTRFARLNGLVNDMQGNPEIQKYLDTWEIKLADRLIDFEGRIVQAEDILYADRVVKYKFEDADWSREGRNLRHISAKSLTKWLVLFPAREVELAEALVDALGQVCTPFGMQCQYPEMVQLPNDRPETYLDALTTKVSKSTNLVVCVLTNNRKDRYDALKKYLCLDNPVPSQMVLTKTISRRQQLMSVATKIGIQLNAKLGGEIWGVAIPTKTLMVIGMDSYHDSKRKGASVGAFVASINPSCTRFYSRIIYQRTAQELMDGLQQCMKDALQEYHNVNNALPDKIILYRDGVSDGQLAVVAEHELPQIVDSLSKIRDGYEPKLAVVIVKKRGNARFFARSGRSVVNPPPGTVIDHTVTNADWYDFYLISQCARQGTVAPTHYNVIWDRTNLKVDHMQRLTFKLCHLYYNWPGTIRVPAVCQYAHKLAFLVGQSLHQDFHHSLADKLFYL
ncbi:unnamed protein product [Didymodactylos carnosus]|uniref:Piwi n=1 Tax=Didymodactylos carnosus TaxID=1234261 RepID=A0A813NP72_9BILA|nr:unnamed protein product [Didymodactylos carnosus]CAF3521350.1 unnamed protein product [Didymodactylos carnosus]